METKTSQLLEAYYEMYSPMVNGEPQYTFGEPIYINFGNSKVEEEDIIYARSYARKLRAKLGDDAKVEQRNCRVVITPKV